MKTAVIYLYPKKLFQSSCSFFFKFCISALLLISVALGFGNLLFRGEDEASANTASAEKKILSALS